VLELPPAPAALVLLGRRFAVFSARSAAAFLLMTVAGPPGGLGDATRAVDEPEGAVAGEVARGADCHECVSTGIQCMMSLVAVVASVEAEGGCSCARWKPFGCNEDVT
jgi:hypothetical protein